MINLIQGDCLEAMKEIPDGSIDLILTDPPYKVISGGNNNDTATGCLSKNDGKVFKYNDLKEEEWFPQIYRLLRANAQCYIMTNTLNLERYLTLARTSGFKIHNLLVWNKNNCIPNMWYMKNCEYTLFLRKGKAFSINIKNSKTVHQIDNLLGRDHPSQKPVRLMELYIKNSSNEGETVLDFTMGSGTTGVACKNLNRNFIGIELDPDYFKIAQQRIAGLSV